VIEWAEKFPQAWPDNVLRIDMAVEPNGARLTVFTAVGQRACAILARLVATHV
jgi:tRNA A37 threonylcarbamoyladenosine biosynthesis protein TsaE